MSSKRTNKVTKTTKNHKDNSNINAKSNKSIINNNHTTNAHNDNIRIKLFSFLNNNDNRRKRRQYLEIYKRYVKHYGKLQLDTSIIDYCDNIMKRILNSTVDDSEPSELRSSRDVYYNDTVNIDDINATTRINTSISTNVNDDVDLSSTVIKPDNYNNAKDYRKLLEQDRAKHEHVIARRHKKDLCDDDDFSDDDDYSNNITLVNSKHSAKIHKCNNSECVMVHSHILQPMFISERSKELQIERSQLPIFLFETDISTSLFDSLILLVVGGTGSGKSTQVIQFLYEAGFCLKCQDGNSLKIAITQPRRAALLAVSNRVKHELADHSKFVTVRMRNYRDTGNIPSNNQRLCFFTEGILINEFKADVLLSKYSTIIVDEVHERSLVCDLLISCLVYAFLLRHHLYCTKKSSLPPLRLVFMSATLNISGNCILDFHKLFSSFKITTVSVPASCFSVFRTFGDEKYDDDDKLYEQYYLDLAARKIRHIHNTKDAGSILVFLPGKPEINALRNKLLSDNNDNGCYYDTNNVELTDDEDVIISDDKIIKPKANSAVINDLHDTNNIIINDTVNHTSVQSSLCDKSVEKLVNNTESLTRVDIISDSTASSADLTEIKGLLEHERSSPSHVTAVNNNMSDASLSDIISRSKRKSRVSYNGAGKGEGTMSVKLLHGDITKKEFDDIFSLPSSMERYVILATNVAETSLTLPNIRYVIDSGLQKVHKYICGSRVSTYVTQFTSYANIEQRIGRAGRLNDGYYYGLYSLRKLRSLPVFPIPEILQVPLDNVTLYISSLGISDLLRFKLIEYIPLKRRLDSITVLVQGGYIREIGSMKWQITDLGDFTTVLQCSLRVGKILFSLLKHIRTNKLIVCHKTLSLSILIILMIEQNYELFDDRFIATSDFIDDLDLYYRIVLYLSNQSSHDAIDQAYNDYGIRKKSFNDTAIECMRIMRILIKKFSLDCLLQGNKSCEYCELMKYNEFDIITLLSHFDSHVINSDKLVRPLLTVEYCEIICIHATDLPTDKLNDYMLSLPKQQQRIFRKSYIIVSNNKNERVLLDQRSVLSKKRPFAKLLCCSELTDCNGQLYAKGTMSLSSLKDVLNLLHDANTEQTLTIARNIENILQH